MHAAVAKVIIMIICAVVFMLINMNNVVDFMISCPISWHASASDISRPLQDGKYHANDHNNQDGSVHGLR